MNDLAIFKHEKFGDVRTMYIDMVAWFCGIDVCNSLGYDQARKAIARHVDKEDGTKHTVLSNGGKQLTLFVNESGLYSLIFGSKLPAAKEFKRWATSEVLPSIRKTGSYSVNQNQSGYTIEQLLEKNEELKNEIVFFKGLVTNYGVIAKLDERFDTVDARLDRLERRSRVFNFETPHDEQTEVCLNVSDELSLEAVIGVLDLPFGKVKLCSILRTRSIFQSNNIPFPEFIDNGYFKMIKKEREQPSLSPVEKMETKKGTLTYKDIKIFLNKLNIKYLEKVELELFCSAIINSTQEDSAVIKEILLQWGADPSVFTIKLHKEPSYIVSIAEKYGLSYYLKRKLATHTTLGIAPKKTSHETKEPILEMIVLQKGLTLIAKIIDDGGFGKEKIPVEKNEKIKMKDGKISELEDFARRKFVEEHILFGCNNYELLKEVYKSFCQFIGIELDVYNKPINEDDWSQHKFTAFLKNSYGLNTKQKKINGYPEQIAMGICLKK